MWKEILDTKEAVIFDLDGTVVDSMWIWKQIDTDYFDKCNLVMPHTYQKEIEGLSFYETAVYTRDTYLPHMTAEELMDDWNRMAYDHYANKVKPKENVREFLEYLKNNGYKLGIATSNSMTLCSATLTSNGLISYFESILTGEDNMPGKPEPDVYLRSAASLGVSPDKCLVFEDICNGILAGNRANMTTVAVHDDYSEYQWEEKKKLADHYIMSYKEITDEICDKKP